MKLWRHSGANPFLHALPKRGGALWGAGQGINLPCRAWLCSPSSRHPLLGVWRGSAQEQGPRLTPTCGQQRRPLQAAEKTCPDKPCSEIMSFADALLISKVLSQLCEGGCICRKTKTLYQKKKEKKPPRQQRWNPVFPVHKISQAK